MEKQKLHQLRRARLKAWIDERYDKNVTAFARTIRKPQSQIADMLDGRKAFGEKITLEIEAVAPDMPPNYLFSSGLHNSNIGEPMYPYHGVQLTRAGAMLAAEWEKLDVADRVDVETEIHKRIAKKHKPRDPPPDPRPAPPDR